MRARVAIITDSETIATKVEAEAKQLSQKLGLPQVLADSGDYDYFLVQNGDRLELRPAAWRKERIKPLYVDFLAGKAAHRQKFGGGKGQLVARAVGLKSSGANLTVLDATAGLGGDAFVLACLGCKVEMLERSPIIAALLADGLERLKQDPEFSDMNLQLINSDAGAYMHDLSAAARPDVVYIDPMFPERTKSALVKKEMRILREIVGEDIDAAELFATALKIAKKRVVVKRSKAAPFLADAKPDLVFKGKSTRFDVYLK
ncbi:MAG: class I SAM-dependent methyltransferase [Gammaproteobacteria bacterium]|nr:class I SAM-dependent methyltransferase [Gammaproteobacteria bacterium]